MPIIRYQGEVVFVPYSLNNIALMGGSDEIEIEVGDNVLGALGFAGNDTITGNEDANSLNGMTGNDTLFGRGGNDTLVGDVGADFLEGGDGDDLLRGGPGSDQLFGDAGDDVLYGVDSG